MSEKKEIGRRIKSLLKELNLKQKEYASKIDMHPNTLGQIIRGEREPGAATLKRIADGLNANIHWIVTGMGLPFTAHGMGANALTGVIDSKDTPTVITGDNSTINTVKNMPDKIKQVIDLDGEEKHVNVIIGAGQIKSKGSKKQSGEYLEKITVAASQLSKSKQKQLLKMIEILKSDED